MVGVEIGNFDQIDLQYKCTVCTLLLEDPIQLTCGHRLCESCIPNEKHVQ